MTPLRTLVQATFPVLVLLGLLELATRLSSWVPTIVSPLGLPQLGQELLTSAALFLIVNAPFIAVESWRPGTAAKRRYGDGLRFGAIYLVVAFVWAKVAVFLSGRLVSAPLFTWSIGPASSTLTIVAGILATYLVFDFFYYWFHRAQHASAFLWRFHRVHHSIEELNCLNSYHHVTEEIFRFPFLALPLALLVKIDVPSLAVVSAFVSAWGHYIHTDARVHLGVLHHVFADNAYHRIHHSTEARCFERNFAAFFPMWDHLFQTYYPPNRISLGPVGLHETRAPRTVAEYLLQPFLRRAPIDRVDAQLPS